MSSSIWTYFEGEDHDAIALLAALLAYDPHARITASSALVSPAFIEYASASSPFGLDRSTLTFVLGMSLMMKQRDYQSTGVLKTVNCPWNSGVIKSARSVQPISPFLLILLDLYFQAVPFLFIGLHLYELIGSKQFSFH